MSLRIRIALAVLFSAALFVAIDQKLQRVRFEQRFGQVDVQRDRASLQRALDNFEALRSDLEQMAAALSQVFPDACADEPIDRRDPRLAQFLLENDLQLAMQVDGLARYGLFDVRDESRRAIELAELPAQLSTNHDLLRGWDMGFVPNGIWSTHAGLLLLGAAQTDHPSLGMQRWIVGRWLDDSMLLDMLSTSRSGLAIVRVAGDQLDAIEAQVLTQLGDGSREMIEIEREGRRETWSAVFSIGDRPDILLGSSSHAELGDLWAEIERDSLLSSLSMVFLFTLTTLWLLQRIVTGPLVHLSKRVVEIGRRDDTGLRLDLERKDEIGGLAAEFDNMLAKLAASRADVVRTARLAGMSEISSGVLHNVGNLLNSVNVSAKLCRQNWRAIELRHLERVLAELIDHWGELDIFLREDARGKLLLPAFERLLGRLEVSIERGLAETDNLEQGVEHIANLVRSLERTDGRVHLAERFQLREVLESALELCRQSIPLPGLEVSWDWPALPALRLDQHQTQEILLQLLANAFQSMQSAGVEPRLLLRAKLVEHDRLALEIIDNGLGIAPERTESIFRLGESGRPGGTGIGLHVAATTATELGGELDCESAGTGQGATFRLVLPRLAG